MHGYGGRDGNDGTGSIGRQGHMRNRKIVRPIVFIDLETTGLSPTWDRIVELTALKVFQRP